MKTKNKTKGLIIAAVISFTATIFSACVPTPGGGAIPTDAFNIGFSVNLDTVWEYSSLMCPYSCSASRTAKKTFLFDGDSIEIKITSMDGYVPGNYFSIKGQMVSIVNINNINGEGAGNYQALYIPSYADDIFAAIAGGATNTSMLAADKTVNSTTYPNDAYPDEYDWHDIYAEKYITNTVNLVPRTITKYFVFRKYKGPNEYLYCWIRIGSKSVVKSYTDQSTNTVKKYMSLETTCYEGKQQLNSIVTGK